MCRVTKRNEKPNGSQGEEEKEKKANGINGEASMRISGDLSSSQASPITSPIYHVAPTTAELDQADSMEFNPSHFIVSPDLILDSSKVFPFVRDN